MAIYYVKNGGNDSADGQSDANAWATISKVNSSSFSAGDYILFRKGDTWRETLDMPSSGSAGNYIHYGSYGTGTNPKILGSKATTTWTDQGSNKWKSNITFTNPQGLYGKADITFITTGGAKVWGKYVSGTAGLVSAYQWTWVSNYIYVYSTSDPASAYTGIEVPQRNPCIDTRYKEYIDIDGIDCFYSGWIGIDANSTHGNTENKTSLTVQNCEVGFIGGRTTAQDGYGLYTPYTNLIVRGCTIHDCGRRGIALNVYVPASVFILTNALIEDNIFYNGYHTTALDISVGADYDNATGWDGITFRRNLVYEPESGQPIYSNQVFLQRYKSATLQNINIYSNIFKYPSYASIMLERCNNINIHNNTFYGGSSDIVPNCHIYTNTSATAISIKNNIFYTLQSTDAGANGAAVYNINIADDQIDDDYNLFYRTSNSLRVYSNRGTAYYMNTIAGIEPNSIASNPLFVSSTDYRLQEGSPAIGEGVDLGIALDYNGFPFDATNPSIGAFEYGSESGYTTSTDVTTTPVSTTPVETTTPIETTTPLATTTPPSYPETDDVVSVNNLSVVGANMGLIGKINKAYSFGGSAYIGDLTSRINALELTSAISISAWFKTNVSDSAYHTIVSNYSADYGYALSMNSSYQIEWLVGNGTSTGVKTTSSTYNDNAWHHVVATFDGNDVLLYMDGVLVGGVPATWNNNIAYSAGNRFIVGARNNAGSGEGYWEGYLDEVAVYNRELQLGDVEDLYNSGTGVTYPFY